MLKTPIIYYGGKTSILHHILPLIPEHDIYCEPFFGGGSVFFAKAPAKNETINDRLDYVINFYRILKSRYPELKQLIEQTLISRSMHRQAQELLKKNGEADQVQKAWAFWYACNFSHSNKIGGGIKFSNSVNTMIPDVLKNKKREFCDLMQKRIESTIIENDEALKVMSKRNKKNAFFYIDPPYLDADQGHYKGYTENDFIDLLTWLETFKGKFLLSHYPNSILSDFITHNNWNVQQIDIRLQTNRKERMKRSELLVYNYPVQATQLKLYDNV